MAPLVSIRVETNELFEAGAELVVESSECFRIGAGRDYPYRDHRFAERNMAAQKLKGNPRVGNLAQRLKDTEGLVGTSSRMLVAELRNAYGPAQQLEAGISHNLEISKARIGHQPWKIPPQG